MPVRSYRHACCLALALAIPYSTAALAAEPPTAPPVLDGRMRAAIIDSLTDQLNSKYVEADTARMITDHLRARLKSGAYDATTSATRFGELVTQDLRHVNGDLHLSLRWDPAGPGAAGGPMIVRRVGGPGGPGGHGGTGGPGGPAGPAGPAGPGGPGGAGGPGGPGGMGGTGSIIIRSTGPGAGPGPGGPTVRMSPDAPAGPAPPWMRDAVERNFGLGRAEVLPGNVGYLEITGFMGAPGAEDAMAAALRFLERTDAVILDVRRNGGGSGGMSHMLFSHFLPAEPVPTIRVKSRLEGMSRDQTSLAEVPGPRRPDVPLWVLTSRGTGSAAEEFSFVLKNLGRATLVGDRTAGAGHMVQMVSLPQNFVAGISITRVSDPRTGREFEAVGVVPDVAVEPERALAVAHAAALRRIIAGATEPARRRSLERLAEWVEARDRPRPVDAVRLAAYAGSYEDSRRVTLVDGRLEYRRGERMPASLVVLDGGRFSIDGGAIIEFGPGSPSPSITLEMADGNRSTYRRVGGKE